MDESMIWVAGASLGICGVALSVFWCVWLRKGEYQMPTTLQGEDQPPDPENPYASMERNLFRFCHKMGRYLYFANEEVLRKDLGFEQMLYIVFMRRFSMFFLAVGVLISLTIFVWARLTTSNTQLIVKRLVGSRDLTLTNQDFNTFISCVYTVVLTLWLFHMRRMMTSRLVANVQRSENNESQHKHDIWFQIRTIKFFGLQPQDVKGKGLRALIEVLLKLKRIDGRLVKHLMLPYMEKRIKFETEISDINENFDCEAYESKGKCGRCLYAMYLWVTQVQEEGALQPRG